MRVLGIDPGVAIVGYAVLVHDGHDYDDVEYGVIRTPASLTLSERLVLIHDELLSLVGRLAPEQVAIEQLFFSNNAKTAFTVGHARGVILYTLAQLGLPVHEYTPTQVKQALVGYGGADKQQIQHFIKMMLNLDAVPKPDDAADALAIAVCHCNSYRWRELEQGKVRR